MYTKLLKEKQNETLYVYIIVTAVIQGTALQVVDEALGEEIIIPKDEEEEEEQEEPEKGTIQ